MNWPAPYQFAGAVLFLSGQLLWFQRRQELPRWHWLLAASAVTSAGVYAWWPFSTWTTDLAHSTMLLAVLWGLAGSWTLHQESRTRGLLLCSCGLMAWMGGAQTIQDLLVGLLAFGYLQISDRWEQGQSVQQPSGILADALALMLACGGLLLLMLAREAAPLGIPTPTLALVLILSGAGWLTRTFPFPQLPAVSEQPPWQTAGTHILPVLLAPVLWMNLLPHLLVNERQLAILMPATILPFLLTGVRFSSRSRTAGILSLVPYVAAFSGMGAVILSGWDLLQPNLSLSDARPLLSGRELLPYILLVDSVGWMVLAASCPERSQPRHSLAWGIRIAGLLILSGLPPFPGYWWRLQLLSALVIPHSRAPLLGLYEVTPGNVIFSGLLALGMLLSMQRILQLLHPGSIGSDNLKDPDRNAVPAQGTDEQQSTTTSGYNST